VPEPQTIHQPQTCKRKTTPKPNSAKPKPKPTL